MEYSFCARNAGRTTIMFLYKREPVFNRKTGVQDDFEVVKTRKVLCDFSGEIIENGLQYATEIKHGCGYEETWYYTNIDWLLKLMDKPEDDEFEVKHWIFSQFYHFKDHNSHGVWDESYSLMDEWVSNVKNEKSIFFECGTLAQAFEISRIRVLKKVLGSKVITVEDLGL